MVTICNAQNRVFKVNARIMKKYVTNAVYEIGTIVMF